MLRLLGDENFNHNIVRGLLRAKPDLEIVRVQVLGLSGANHPTVLKCAATERRVLLTQDVSTMTRHVYQRLNAGHPLPGVFEVNETVPVVE